MIHYFLLFSLWIINEFLNVHVNGEGISLLRFFLFPSSCPFLHACACHAGYPQASYIMLHFDVSFRSTWIAEFGIHPGLGWFIFLNTQVLLWDVAQERKKAMKKEALYGNFCIGIESTTALPWIPKMVNFVISIPALVHMGGLMYAMVVSFPSTFTLLLLPQRLLHFSHYNSVHNVTNA